MKICKKCKVEYKDEYSFCPKCGTPYAENVKKPKVPGEIGGTIWKIINIIINIVLYIFGGLLILAYVTQIKDNPVSSILGIIFGLSLFHIFYKIVGDKFSNIEKKYLIIARIIIPIILFFVWVCCSPSKPATTDNTNAQSNNQVVENNEIKE